MPLCSMPSRARTGVNKDAAAQRVPGFPPKNPENKAKKSGGGGNLMPWDLDPNYVS